jgi:hypothetical protein
MDAWEGKMTEPKWNVEKIHKEVYDARTKLFVIFKVLETGSINFKEHPEWALIVRPLLKEISEFSGKIEGLIGDQESMVVEIESTEPQ